MSKARKIMKRLKKSILIPLLTCGVAATALAQGAVVFEDAYDTGSITIGPNTGPASYAAAGTYTVALLWAPGTAVVPHSALTQIALYGLATGDITQAGYFLDHTPIFTGPATAPGTSAIFEVQGWTGNYTSYSAGVNAGAYVGQSYEFVNLTGGPVAPQGPSVLLDGWDGNLILTPEPSTLVLASLGAGALIGCHRRK